MKDSEYWLSRAAEARKKADAMMAPQARASMLQAAANCEHLAALAKQREREKPPGSN